MLVVSVSQLRLKINDASPDGLSGTNSPAQNWFYLPNVDALQYLAAVHLSRSDYRENHWLISVFISPARHGASCASCKVRNLKAVRSRSRSSRPK